MDIRKDDQKQKQSSDSTRDSGKIQIGGRSPAFTSKDTKDKKKIRIGGRSPSFR